LKKYLVNSGADIHAGMQANVRTVGVQWLPEYQTLEFSVAPHFLLKSIEEFLHIVPLIGKSKE
jgi:phosphoglycolate phosphatase-like HAD superfamily hydrolase